MIIHYSHIEYLIFSDDGDVIGRLALQYGDEETPEIAITIVKKYQHQGYGYDAMRKWLPMVSSEFDYKVLYAKIEESNKDSLRLFEKMGAVQESQKSEVITMSLEVR